MTDIERSVSPAGTLPGWVPPTALLYLSHTEAGWSIRALARSSGCHASTVLRRIRRFEESRDDPLIDAALRELGRTYGAGDPDGNDEECCRMPERDTADAPIPDETTIAREARRILPRLCEADTVLAVSQDMAKAVVLRERADGRPTRIAVVEREVAQAFALKDWIAAGKPGRIATYRVTAAGRAAVRRLHAEDENRNAGMAEAQSPFAEQHRDWATREIPQADGAAPRRMRYNAAESPIASLARRREKNGMPFLSPDLVGAGERLREDFELAQMGPQVTQNWDRFLTGGDRGSYSASGPGDGPGAARDRVAAALSDLGPGLGDIVLRCICFMEGMETAEKRLGWSARSGKVVLRIALVRLHRHYDAQSGSMSRMIG